MEFEGSVDAYRKGQGDAVFTLHFLFVRTNSQPVRPRKKKYEKISSGKAGFHLLQSGHFIQPKKN